VKCYIQGITTRYGQMGKFRAICDTLTIWRKNVPAFLDWDKRNSALSHHVRQQRPFLEMQYRSIETRLNLAIAHLEPLLISKPSTWEIGNAYGDSVRAARRILDIVEESGLDCTSIHLYHRDAIRATTIFLQIFLRNDFDDSKISVVELIESCRRGVRLCRISAVGGLTQPEEDIEAALHQYDSFSSAMLTIAIAG